MAPVAFNLLRLVACGAEMINDFFLTNHLLQHPEEGLSQPVFGYSTSVIELEWQQHLERAAICCSHVAFPLTAEGIF